MHLQHCQTLCTKIKGGQLNLRRLPGPVWDFLSLFEAHPKHMTCTSVFSYIKNTRVWRWMWSCHDFLLYRVRLLQPGYRSDTFWTACCVLGCFFQSRSWNGGFIMYMQRTSISTRSGFNLPSDQFYECFKWPRCIAPMRLFLQMCLSIWNPFGPHYSRFLDRHCCSTCQSSIEGFFSMHIYGQNPRGRKPHSSKPVFQSAQKAEESKTRCMCTVFVNGTKLS